ncbi:MAG TPA: class I adenylate-forming enzyme family protein [Acidobacteriota bacterium]|nr:class I adenylate-forming enzyme family protein [Acidobacteriota bacterium]
MNVIDLLTRTAATFPDKAALIHQEQRISFGELWSAVSRLASRLQQLNLAPGSRVAILFENSIDYAVSFFAVFESGLVAVPLDTSLGPENHNFILADCQASVLLVQGRYRRHLGRILGDNLSLRLLVSDKPVAVPGSTVAVETFEEIGVRDVRVDPPAVPESAGDDTHHHELAAIFYTSGSTGSSKGVMLSHLNLVSNTLATVEYLRLTPDDSVLVILPFYYIYGNSLLLTHVAVGGTLVIDNRFMYPEVVLDTMEREEVTGFSGVPSNFMILLNNSTFASRKLEHLRYFTQAGGAMAPEVIRKLMDAFGHKEIFIMYGQTEAAPRVTWLPPEKLSEKLGSIGIPVPGVTVEVLSESGQTVIPGETGEITVVGDNVMLGYWNQPEETAEVLHDGRLYTGDLARVDEDGYFYVVGRKREIIKTGGHRVSAKEIEERILEHEKVAEATVFGVRDDILGEAIRAVVVLRPGCQADEKEIQSHCQKKLAAHQIPKRVQFMDALPKYQSGKVNKMALKNRDS